MFGHEELGGAVQKHGNNHHHNPHRNPNSPLLLTMMMHKRNITACPRVNHLNKILAKAHLLPRWSLIL